jgi:hypothetical protein
MRRPSRVGICIVGLVATSLLTACSSEPGTPKPVPSSEAVVSGGKQLPSAGAPKVAMPLPSSLIKGDPCKALTAEQIKALFSGAQPELQPARDTGAAMQCRWANIDLGSSVGIQLVYAWNDGLSRVYATKGQGFFKELEPVQGYPVVAYGPTDDRSSGMCSVAVGIADNAAFEADAALARSKVGQSDPCDAARKIADFAVTTLKAGA